MQMEINSTEVDRKQNGRWKNILNVTATQLPACTIYPINYMFLWFSIFCFTRIIQGYFTTTGTEITWVNKSQWYITEPIKKRKKTICIFYGIYHISRVSCQKGAICHAYIVQGPFDRIPSISMVTFLCEPSATQQPFKQHWNVYWLGKNIPMPFMGGKARLANMQHPSFLNANRTMGLNTIWITQGDLFIGYIKFITFEICFIIRNFLMLNKIWTE